MFSGKNGSILLTIDGKIGGDQFGNSVDGIGDINGDGYPDVVVGAPQPNLVGLSGYVKVVSGKDGKLLARINGAKIMDRFGFSVSGAGDVNNDGTPDMLVGAPEAQKGLGTVTIISGKTFAPLHTFVGLKYNDRFGWAVDGGTDVNGDGRPDILVGARSEDRPHVDNGAVHLFSGKDTKLLRVFAGDATGDWFGSSVSFGGDVNKDGTPDILVGARFAKGTGSASVFSGKDGSRLDVFYGDSKNDAFGASIGSLGDINKDGYADFIVGAPDDDTGSALSTGMARVFSGKELTLLTDTHKLSLKTAGAQKMTLAAGAAHANKLYHVFGSVTGSNPGITLNGVHIPLNIDMYTEITLGHANSPMFSNFRGKLDNTGMATATFNVPSGLPSLANMTLTHAFIVYDTNGRYRMASNAATLRLEN